ncbi:hypothetical protein SAMN05421833_1594 [Microbispora rosea]|uniref:Uncharacterized protein n=1 Tax=Microbispora rosea TaxID=58117 RepID=A0A1N7HK78_9ACTN|nr:hypothetical protein [Microbispora rosea]GIH53029.1 hypothetical protein Mro03_82080 [Microbispora rosea subsp. rosea]SIS25080.1 hypothetical protein SAMN05421833_1594 [Microbispora rosea]
MRRGRADLDQGQAHRRESGDDVPQRGDVVESGDLLACGAGTDHLSEAATMEEVVARAALPLPADPDEVLATMKRRFAAATG